MRFRALFLAFVALAGPLLSALPAEAGEKIHKVARGQTLVAIAKRYRVKVSVIQEVNDLRPGQLLRPGLVLVIPERGKEEESLKKAAEKRKSRDKEGARAKDAESTAKGKKGRSDKKSQAKGDKKKGDVQPPDNNKGTYELKPKRMGFVKMVRGDEQASFQLLTRKGKLIPAALPHLSRMMRFGPTGAQIAADPRLATMIGMVSDHFGGRTLHVVSGFRPFSRKQYTRHSKHNLGHAMDFSIEGVPNTVLRDFCKTFRHAGVGYYPNSSFVHLDARPEKVYWVDYSRPGEAPRYNRVRPQATPAPAQPNVDGDEAADDLDEDSSAPGSAGDSGGGSKETQGSPSQPIDSSNGNRDSSTSGNEKAAGAGQN